MDGDQATPAETLAPLPDAPLAQPGVEVLSGQALDGVCELGPRGVAIIRQ